MDALPAKNLLWQPWMLRVELMEYYKNVVSDLFYFISEEEFSDVAQNRWTGWQIVPNRETHRFLILSWRVTQFLTLVLQCPTFLWPSGPTEDCATVYPIWLLVAIKFCQNWNLNLNDFDIIIVVSKVLFQKKLNSKNRFCQERPNFVHFFNCWSRYLVAKFLVLSKSDGNQKPNWIHCVCDQPPSQLQPTK